MTHTSRTFVDLSTGHRRRITRRTLLTNFGAAGVGLTILGACGGSSGTGANPTTQQASGTTPPGSDPSATESTTAEVEETADTSVGTSTPTAPADTAVTTTDVGLQLQHVSLGFVSAYVLLRGSEAAIVDTGTSDSREAILEGMALLSVTPAMVRHIVLTHNHGDHAGGLGGLEADLTNATVYVGAEDIGAIRSTLTLEELTDGDEVFGMGVIGTPGHTPGSISLFDAASGILVAGDAINGDGAGGLTGANPDFTPDMETAAASVTKLAALMPTVAAFGHGGPPVTDDVSAKLAAL
jgi:glyoxylase-like metal-dependent hydrolase (beta-lactamase superfamily II)